MIPEVKCPGCQKKMEEAALVGLWIRPDGTVEPYQTCVRCSRVLASANETARDWLTARIEDVLTAAVEAKQEVIH